jgi:hypothetical protein
MSRPKGSIIGARPTWTTTATSGIWTLRQAEEMKAAAQWPRGPVAPTSLAGTGGNGQVALTWTAPATTHGTITNYAVEYTPSGGSPTVVLTGSTAASYTVTSLTNDTEYTFRVAAINHTQGEWSGTATATPTDVANLEVSASYRDGQQGLPATDFSASGAGTAGSPLVVIVGGDDDDDNRIWVLINQTGTLSWNLAMSSESGYDFGRLYRTTGSPTTHSIGGNVPPVSTLVKGSTSGTETASGTLAVSAGQYLICQYIKDESSSSGNDNATFTLSIA